jgi:hypothetical protein
MGANFCTMSIPASLPRTEVTKQFQDAQNQDRYDNGHSYSGGLGMATGLLFEDKTFDNVDMASNYLVEACVKWEEARAVCHNTLDGQKMWLIGAWCAS